jgi:hypothetical protein
VSFKGYWSFSIILGMPEHSLMKGSKSESSSTGARCADKDPVRNGIRLFRWPMRVTFLSRNTKKTSVAWGRHPNHTGRSAKKGLPGKDLHSCKASRSVVGVVVE